MEMIPVQAQILRGCQCTRSTAMGHRTECSILPNQSVSLMTKGPKKHLSAFSPEIIIIQINFKLCHFCKREDIVDHVRHTAAPRHQHKHTLTPQITASNEAGGRKEPRFLQTLDPRRLHFLHCVSWGGECVTSFLWCSNSIDLRGQAAPHGQTHPTSINLNFNEHTTPCSLLNSHPHQSGSLQCIPNARCVYRMFRGLRTEIFMTDLRWHRGEFGLI